MSDQCQCRCETCLDSDCEGTICKPHDKGRWIIVSPFMAHPLPTDFGSQEAADEFLSVLSISHLSAVPQEDT